MALYCASMTNDVPLPPGHQGMARWPVRDDYVVMEAQDRIEAQIELQRLHATGQFFAPVSYQEGFDDEDE